MKINGVYIGGWFQRTALHLSEIYEFLRDGSSSLKLNQHKLAELRHHLNISSIEYGVAGQEFVQFLTTDQMQVKFLEDGLIIASINQTSDETIFTDVERLKDYYETRLAPTLNYLFSLGVPVVKNLATMDQIYPCFVSCDNAKQNEISELLARTERQKYFEFDAKNYSVLRGDQYYFIVTKKAGFANLEHCIEEQIFIREFKKQLQSYLDKHRTVWENVAAIRKSQKVRGQELDKFTIELNHCTETADNISGRLEQMQSYLVAREHAIKNDKELIDFLAISGYRYDSLHVTLDYVKGLWAMTRDYINSTRQLISNLKKDAIIDSINVVAVLVLMIVGVNILGLFIGEASFSIFGCASMFVIAVIGWLAAKIIPRFISQRQYHVSETENNAYLDQK